MENRPATHLAVRGVHTNLENSIPKINYMHVLEVITGHIAGVGAKFARLCGVSRSLSARRCDGMSRDLSFAGDNERGAKWRYGMSGSGTREAGVGSDECRSLWTPSDRALTSSTTTVKHLR